MPEGRDGVDPRVVIGPVIRDLAARRLARGYFALVALAAVCLVEFALRGEVRGTILITLGGAAASGLGMLALGMTTVRRAFGEPARLWAVGAGLGSVGGWAFGVWLFGFRGLRELAVGSPGVLGGVFALLYLGFGLRLLQDLIRVGAVRQLAGVMSVPAPEEAGT